nr:MAG TPA: Major capsid protein [Bacteriophage sp.]
MAIPSNAVRVVEQRRMGRVLRSPQHTFQLRQRPWQIQPFMIAPVLPGETLKSGLLQSRVITDPIKNRFLGWWAEYYWFYVKHRDLDERDQFTQMVLDPSWTPAAVDSATDVQELYYEGGTGSGTLYINWLEKCLKRITEEYFRTEGEAWDTWKIGNLPVARATNETWWQSAQPEADVDFRDVSISTAGDNAFNMGELNDAQRMYEWLRSNGAVQMTYEEYLRSYGVAVPKAEELHTPELIRFVRQWANPVSAIDPSDGSDASAVTWQFSERIDKDRYFKEPGFIIGVSVVRPKVYMSRQLGYAAAMLNDAYSWLPALLSDDPATSLKLLPDNNGLIGDQADAGGVWVDVKDLFLYGDQFVNFGVAETDAGMVALPTTALQKKYADATMADAFFANAAPLNKVRQEGLMTLNIAGTQVDTSS